MSEPHSTESLAAEVRRRLGPSPELEQWPSVSIVVLNRDGVDHLRRLLSGLVDRTDYPHLELIVVDNASSDDSLRYLRTVATPFPISILANAHNESFSDACNQGAELASGELLLFLNNDVEPFESGWLRELVACLRKSGAGAASATLLCGDEEHEASFDHGFGVQHRGLRFQAEEGMLVPVLHGWEADPLGERLGRDGESSAVAAACLVVSRDTHASVGGFSHGYVYGVEDVDFCLKLRAAGLHVTCSGRSLAIHHPASTRRTAPFAPERARRLANRRLLWERWGPRLRREYELDLLSGAGLWASENGATGLPEPASGDQASRRDSVESLGFCLRGSVLAPAQRDRLLALRDSLTEDGGRCLLLEGDAVDDPRGLDHDVAVHVKGASRYILRPGQLNVLWDVAGPAPASIQQGGYDLVLTATEHRTVVETIRKRIAEQGRHLRIGSA